MPNRTPQMWESPKPAYRARLIRAGIGPDEYVTGASLSAARGHKATPERPTRAYRRPNQYRPYLQRRSDSMGDFVAQAYASGMTNAYPWVVDSPMPVQRNMAMYWTAVMSQKGPLTDEQRTIRHQMFGYIKGLDQTEIITRGPRRGKRRHVEFDWQAWKVWYLSTYGS